MGFFKKLFKFKKKRPPNFPWTKERIEELVKLRDSINPETKKYPTLEELGKRYNLTRERIRQVLKIAGKTGSPNKHLDMDLICLKCGTKKVIRGGLTGEKRKFCSKRCADESKWILGKSRSEYTLEDWKKFNKHTNYLSGRAEYRKDWAKRDYVIERRLKLTKTPEYRAYHREYAKRPHVRKRNSTYLRERYRTDPEYRKKILENWRKYYQRKKNKIIP